MGENPNLLNGNSMNTEDSKSKVLEKEYIIWYGFWCPRLFIVKADSEEQARERFDMASKEWNPITCGFTLKDVTKITLKEE